MTGIFLFPMYFKNNVSGFSVQHSDLQHSLAAFSGCSYIGTTHTAAHRCVTGTDQTDGAFCFQLHRILIKRKYCAILEGDIADYEGWIETWLYENPKSMMVHCYPFESGDDAARPPRREWRFASSHCRTLRKGEIEGKPYTCVEFSLETGRKNQIRVHSQWIGHPIAGDRKYGASTDPLERLALHAQTLSFIHPRTGKTMNFSSPLPKSFRKLKEGPVGQ